MIITSEFELYTYYDTVVCRDCAVGIGVYCNKTNVEMWYSEYDYMLKQLTKHMNTDERVCPICGGIMMWSVFDESDGIENDECVYMCTNCGHWIYDDFYIK